MIKRSIGEKVFDVFNIILLTVISLIMLYPFLHVIFASLSDPMEYMKHSVMLFKPVGFSTLAYEKVLAKPEIWTGYMNTLIYTVGGTLISMLLTITLGYGLAKREMMLVKPISALIVLTMYFGGGLIPQYMVVRTLGLTDTRWAMLLPLAINTFNLIIMRGAFMAVPKSLEEAALIDGASNLKLLFKIIIPVCKPTIAVLVLYYASAQWNTWFQASIYLRDNSLYPLQLYLRDILITSEQTDMLIGADSAQQLALSSIIKYATIIVATVPILCVYPFLQKYFAKGVMVGAVKG